MSLEAKVALNWLDKPTADGFPLKSLVAQLTTPSRLEKLVAYQDSMQGLGGLFRDVFAVLEQLQSQANGVNEGVTSGLVELLYDFVWMAYRLREFIERFSEESPLCQLVRSQKVVDFIVECRDGVDEFVYGVEQSEIFHRVAADASIDFSVVNQNQAHWREQVGGVMEALQREITAIDMDVKTPGEMENAVSTLKYETQRVRRRGAFSPHLDKLAMQLSAFMTDVELMPWLIPSDDITLLHEIGSGGYGLVYLGMLRSKTQVVVKCIVNKFDKAALLREISICYLLKHPHILQFYGATFLDSDCSIVSEFARHGRLDRYLAISGNKKHLWRLLYEAALGLHYMHDMGYVHGDLKCDNIFVGDDLKAKLADFGLSFKKGDHKKVRCTQAVNALAPECVIADQERSFPADVFAFGMCIVEAVYGGPAWGRALDTAARRFVKQGTLPDSVSKLAPDVQKLVKAMCAFDPLKRMTLEDVIAKLKQFADAKGDDQVHLLAGGVEKK